ncbi:D-lactaldehyde dehydrogenase [Coprinopsis sp. MPI-PUGE-AT-0042]|nr:D-lactaldehyde dehydrogenase [Coprinopsis sp. MPI-PUGE-AT-0042]
MALYSNASKPIAKKLSIRLYSHPTPMAVVKPQSKILVTGSNGYIGMWIVHSLLQKGYYVRAVVRSPEKGKHMQSHFNLKAHGDRLGLAIVPDMTKEGAFDEAVKDVEGVVHTASPVGIWKPSVTVEEFYEPAVKGTTGILQSVTKAGPTGSIAAVLEAGKEEQRTYTEVDWNEVSEKTVAEKGSEAGALVIYIASKTIAEKAAWEFYNKHKSEANWQMSVLHPPMPLIQDVDSLEKLDGSMKAFWDQMIPETKKYVPMPGAWVDVRDLTDAHVLALEKEEAGGERIFISAGPLVWQDWGTSPPPRSLRPVRKLTIILPVDTANTLEPSALPGHKLTPSWPDPERKAVLDFSNAKEQKILGVKYRPLRDTVKDSMEDFAARGFFSGSA